MYIYFSEFRVLWRRGRRCRATSRWLTTSSDSSSRRREVRSVPRQCRSFCRAARLELRYMHRPPFQLFAEENYSFSYVLSQEDSSVKKLADALCNRVLHTVYMGSENSTTDTRLVPISVFFLHVTTLLLFCTTTQKYRISDSELYSMMIFY